MSIHDFVLSATVHDQGESARLRNLYVDAFVDVTSDFYKRNIGSLKQFSDGLFYEGYLWDCLKNAQVIQCNELCSSLRRNIRRTMVMWDLHSQKKIPVPNYWLFERDRIIEVTSDVLVDNVGYLPEDIYIFDEGMTWTLVTTHEHAANGERICIRAERT